MNNAYVEAIKHEYFKFLLGKTNYNIQIYTYEINWKRIWNNHLRKACIHIYGSEEISTQIPPE